MQSAQRSALAYNSSARTVRDVYFLRDLAQLDGNITPRVGQADHHHRLAFEPIRSVGSLLARTAATGRHMADSLYAWECMTVPLNSSLPSIRGAQGELCGPVVTTTRSKTSVFSWPPFTNVIDHCGGAEDVGATFTILVPRRKCLCRSLCSA
jgi:hypothetical protein